jgi:hypothetical protein
MNSSVKGGARKKAEKNIRNEKRFGTFILQTVFVYS